MGCWVRPCQQTKARYSFFSPYSFWTEPSRGTCLGWACIRPFSNPNVYVPDAPLVLEWIHNQVNHPIRGTIEPQLWKAHVHGDLDKTQSYRHRPPWSIRFDPKDWQWAFGWAQRAWFGRWEFTHIWRTDDLPPLTYPDCERRITVWEPGSRDRWLDWNRQLNSVTKKKKRRSR